MLDSPALAAIDLFCFPCKATACQSLWQRRFKFLGDQEVLPAGGDWGVRISAAQADKTSQQKVDTPSDTPSEEAEERRASILFYIADAQVCHAFEQGMSKCLACNW